MNKFRALKVLKVLVLVAVALTVFGFVTEHLWNWLMPAIFGLKTITFVQALGLVVLSKILLGGFHKHGGGPRGWKRGMEDRWARMSPEEREKFREGMKRRRDCGWRPGEGFGRFGEGFGRPGEGFGRAGEAPGAETGHGEGSL